MKRVVCVAVVVVTVLAGGVVATRSEPPAITGLSLTNNVLTISFAGGELQTSPSVTGPWTGSGNTSGQYSEVIGPGSSNEFCRVRGPALLAVSSISPATYTVAYNALAVGQPVYWDRSYAFTSVASLGGSTYIKTANDDKQSTGSSFLTFNVNRNVRVYVAHDDRISPKPSWMSAFTATSEYLGTEDQDLRLYYEEFAAGTITLGGNGGLDDSSSMYSVVIVPIAPPGQASSPSPANSVTNVSANPSLSWTAGGGASSHDVYFGTSNPPVFQVNQTGTSYSPGALSQPTTYYWRIDEKNLGGTTAGPAWTFTTEPPAPLAISNVIPPFTVQYDSLAVGQSVYLDRSYTYTSVPPAYQGKTFIQTRNADKSYAGSSFLTFSVNQDVTVYVAYADAISPKPSWLSAFTDTGAHLATSDSGKQFSLYRKDFNAGTVSLGGNAGDAYSSMYMVVVLGKGTVTPALPSDFYSDTWAAVDALGRALPNYSNCGAPRTNRQVGLFYYLWLGEHGTGGPYDNTKLLAANPANPAWGPKGAFHHWGESEQGYYLSSDQWVMRKHADMLANAGVDVIIIDISNGFTYTDNCLALCSVFSDIRANGGTTPQIAFLAYAGAPDSVQNVYDNLYSKGLYSNLWFYWKGKPLILAPLNGMVINGTTNTYSSTILNFFNMRYSWTWMNVTRADVWKWMDFYPQQYGWHESSSIPEQISVSCGIVPHGNLGRSFHNGVQPAHDQYDLSGTQNLGLCFAEQWHRLNTIDPEFLFLTQWNEWVAERQVFVGDGSDPVTSFVGDPLSPGDTWFIDEYNQEYSRDIEPMKDGHTDNYYYQMIDGIRRYKGVRPLPVPSAAKTITIDGLFTDWDSVGPTYRDWVGDTMHRNAAGWGSAGTYTNHTGRNDFVAAKVARDDTHIYFYIQTDANITPYTDSNWMLLFINADQNYSTGWNGYDYVVNMGVINSTTTTLMHTGSGWDWTNVNTNLAYRVSGNKMEIRVPRSDLGQGSGAARVAFDFKWADNIQAINDIIQFAISGDSAPDRRFNYRYDTSP